MRHEGVRAEGEARRTTRMSGKLMDGCWSWLMQVKVNGLGFGDAYTETLQTFRHLRKRELARAFERV